MCKSDKNKKKSKPNPSVIEFTREITTKFAAALTSLPLRTQRTENRCSAGSQSVDLVVAQCLGPGVFPAAPRHIHFVARNLIKPVLFGARHSHNLFLVSLKSECTNFTRETVHTECLNPVGRALPGDCRVLWGKVSRTSKDIQD